MNKKTTKHKARAGRPTAAQSEQRHWELLDTAMDLFLKKGFEQTTVDSIAKVMHMTKRTIYTRYPSKEALFNAAVNQAIEGYFIPIAELEKLETEDLEATLVAQARLMVENYLSPRGLRLHRVINSEVMRFPDLTRILFEKDTKPIIAYLTGLFARHQQSGELNIERPEATGALFFASAVGATARGTIVGSPLTDIVDREDHIRFAVKLFLNGIRARQLPGPPVVPECRRQGLPTAAMTDTLESDD